MELKLDGEPADVGLDGGRLERISSYFDGFVAAGRVAGWLVTVNRAGKLVWVGRGGHRDREKSLDVGDDTIWRLFSMTKPLTTVAAMMLYEEGKFDLNDDVSQWIEELAEPRVFVSGTHLAPQTVPANGPVRVQHLLTHTAGFTYGFQYQSPVDALQRALGYDEMMWKFPEGADLAHAVRDWSSVPLLFEPGTAWNYSIATEILGRLIEIWSGQRLDEFIGARILEPLGMTDTDWHCPPDKVDRLAMLYFNLNGLAVPLDEIASAFTRRPDLLLGGGGLVSTAHDFQRFMSMMLAGGSFNGETLLTPRSVAMMTRNQLPGGRTIAEIGQGIFSDDLQSGMGYGLGVSVVVDAVRNRSLVSEGSYSWGGAASTAFWIDPHEELSVALYTQLLPSTSYPWRRALQQFVYASLAD